MSISGELDQLYSQKRAIVIEELYLTGEALNQAYAKEDEIQKMIDQKENKMWTYIEKTGTFVAEMSMLSYGGFGSGLLKLPDNSRVEFSEKFDEVWEDGDLIMWEATINGQKYEIFND